MEIASNFHTSSKEAATRTIVNRRAILPMIPSIPYCIRQELSQNSDSSKSGRRHDIGFHVTISTVHYLTASPIDQQKAIRMF